MPSRYWIKFYIEVLDDPKMGRLSDRLWRRACELFLVAGETHDNGSLPSPEDLAWRLRLPIEELNEDLGQLAELGILKCNDGGWHVANFSKRQAPSTDAERQRQSRERKRKSQYHDEDDATDLSQDVTDNVTEPVTRCDVDTDTDPDAKTEPDKTEDEKTVPAPPPSTFKAWHELVQVSKNRPATLRFMHETLFPGRDPPSYGYIGKTAKKVGGAGRLAELLWQASTKPPTGDLMRYVQGMAKGQRRDQEPVGLDALALLIQEEAEIGNT